MAGRVASWLGPAGARALAAVLAVLLVGGVVAAATVGSGDDGPGQEKTAAADGDMRPAPATTALGQSGGGELVGPPVTGSGGSPSPTTIPPSGSAATVRPGSSGSPGSTAPAVTQAPPPPAPQGARFAAAGTYTYTVQGKSKSAFGEQDQSGSTTTVYDAPQGADQRSVAKGANGTTEQILRSTADAALIQYLKIDGGFFAFEFRPEPGVLALPRGAKAGRAWSWKMTSTDRKTTVEAAFTVRGTESVTVAGKPVATTVIDNTMKITSDTITASSTSTRWVSEDLALIVKDTDHTEGTFRGTPFTTDATRTLTSTTPT